MKYLPLAGRIIFSLHFLMAAPFHFSANAIGYASSQGVPMAGALVPLSGIIALIGSLSIVLGYKAKLGAWLLIAFLIPVNFMMHPFWNITDAMQQQSMMAFFMKDLSMTGAALLIAYWGAGPISLDARKSS